jgi:hypothetical protein
VIWPIRFQAGSRESLNAGGALALGDPLRNKSAGCLNDWASRLRGERASASASTIGVATRHTVACDRCAWVLFAVKHRAKGTTVNGMRTNPRDVVECARRRSRSCRLSLPYARC